MKNKSESSEQYKRRLLSIYPDLDLNWYNSIENICSISNIKLIEKNNSEWRVSIQNNIPKEIKKNINKNKRRYDHLKEHCVKIAFEFNVAVTKFPFESARVGVDPVLPNA